MRRKLRKSIGGHCSPLKSLGQMNAVLRFDRGTLLLEGGEPPIALRGSFVHDPRVDVWRTPAISYPKVIPLLRGRLEKNTAPRYRKLMLEPRLTLDLYPHQKEALERWKAAGGRGLVCCPRGRARHWWGC
jgi:hypothetical protein